MLLLQVLLMQQSGIYSISWVQFQYFLCLHKFIDLLIALATIFRIQILREIKRYLNIGVTYFTLCFPDTRSLQLFAEHIIRHFKNSQISIDRSNNFTECLKSKTPSSSLRRVSPLNDKINRSMAHWFFTRSEWNRVFTMEFEYWIDYYRSLPIYILNSI